MSYTRDWARSVAELGPAIHVGSVVALLQASGATPAAVEGASSDGSAAGGTGEARGAAREGACAVHGGELGRFAADSPPCALHIVEERAASAAINGRACSMRRFRRHAA
eukprot:153047-Chlamydomonas_euryale.AAC.13